ncbi:hypothetical protein PENVUL_c001G04985 [Penicillium vulpinum]|uniref:Uncharacterized protein n=1 Tax=Penicillium vulpinum TaxID=29845 RepID=A0A1V6SDR4_9EURO|nr:hypothetical protein PENVUL_c001G04985 [Penicillium vulpinum]
MPTQDPVLPSSTEKDAVIDRVEPLHETQDGANDPIQSPKSVPKGTKSVASGSDAELENALNKFFGGPPFSLVTPAFIEAHTKPVRDKRGQQDAAGTMGKQDVGPVNSDLKSDIESLTNLVPGPMKPALTPTTSNLSSQPDRGIKISDESKGKVKYDSEEDIKGASHRAQEFQAETSRSRPNTRQPDSQPRHNLGFSGWGPMIVADNTSMSAHDPIKPGTSAHNDDGSVGSSNVKSEVPATPTCREYIFIPWVPSPKKGSGEGTKTKNKGKKKDTGPSGAE